MSSAVATADRSVALTTGVEALDAVLRRWGRDTALDLFLTICPRLYRRRSVALWLFDASSCDQGFVERLTGVTQVAIRLHGFNEDVEAEVIVAAGRASEVVGRRLPLTCRNGRFQRSSPVNPERHQLGDTIRTHRQARGWSQAQLARQVGITPSGLSQIERGVRGLAGEIQAPNAARRFGTCCVDPANSSASCLG